MKRSTKYVALDVHQATTVASVRGESGRVIVCDRRGESRQGNKGDQVYADQLSEQLRRGRLRAVYHRSAHHGALNELTRR